MLYFILLPFCTLLFLGFISCKKWYFNNILTAKKKFVSQLNLKNNVDDDDDDNN